MGTSDHTDRPSSIDARLTRIGEGTSEILKLVIARRLLEAV